MIYYYYKKVKEENKMFEEYAKGLNKTENKQFQRVLELYPELRPRYYNQVKAKITGDKKTSPKTQEKMLEFNDYIFESFFTSLGFIKEAGEFSIGNKVFVDGEKEEKIISEFVENGEDIFVIFEGDRKVVDKLKMIQRIHHCKRDEGKSFFLNLKNKTLFDDLTVITITSSLGSFLDMYAEGEYDFDPEYQRELVWTTEQKQAFIKALMIGKAEIQPIFIYNPTKRKARMEILDGKQRLTAILEYVRGNFEVEGLYYKDLNSSDISIFNYVPMVYKEIKYYDHKVGLTNMPMQQKIELFLQVNGYGQHVSDEHLEKIRKEYVYEN